MIEKQSLFYRLINFKYIFKNFTKYIPLAEGHIYNTTCKYSFFKFWHFSNNLYKYLIVRFVTNVFRKKEHFC
jgi:hypothetical protein